MPDDAFTRGARLFDAGAFFEAHEAWEEYWRVEASETQRRFLQGLIQIAAAFHKLFVMESPGSASRLLAKGLAKLDACREQVAERGLAAFRDAVAAYARAVAAGRIDRAAVPRMLAPDATTVPPRRPSS
jgi:predicted metal-dependent hydrolase